MNGCFLRAGGVLIECMLIFGLASATTGCGWLKHQSTQPVNNASRNAPDLVSRPHDHNHELDNLNPLPRMEAIYFAYDQSGIQPDQIAAMEFDLKFMRENPDWMIFITGHADERGSTEYNFSLGMKRAAAVKEYFIDHGIAAKRIYIGSKGKEQPAVIGNSEKAWSKNRRAEFQRYF